MKLAPATPQLDALREFFENRDLAKVRVYTVPRACMHQRHAVAHAHTPYLPACAHVCVCACGWVHACARCEAHPCVAWHGMAGLAGLAGLSTALLPLAWAGRLS